MFRLTAILTLIPTVLLAQAPASAPKAPAATQTPKAPATPAKPGVAKPAPAGPAARKPAPAASKAAAAPAPMTDDEKVIYALGLVLQGSLSQFDLSAPELDVLKRGLTDAAQGKPAIDLDEWGPKIEPFAAARGQRVVLREKAAGVAYLAKAAAEAGAVKTTSGLVYREVSAGTGRSPNAGDTVRVNYRGTLINGTEFDSSYGRNEPAEFALGRVIGCWTEGLQHMKVGGKARLVCPSNLAYGDAGSAPIPGGAALIFDVELLAIVGQ
jgi:FKBP-type peptidyl-prolyl cis-trans isomerase FkpA